MRWQYITLLFLLTLMIACESITISPPESIMFNERDQGADVPIAGEIMLAGTSTSMTGGETTGGETTGGEMSG